MYEFAFVKIMYFDCQTEQFEEKNKVSGKIITKRIKVHFISSRRVSALVDGFVKQVLKKQWPFYYDMVICAMLCGDT